MSEDERRPFVLFGRAMGEPDPSPVIEGATVIDTGGPEPGVDRDEYYLWSDDAYAPWAGLY